MPDSVRRVVLAAVACAFTGLLAQVVPGGMGRGEAARPRTMQPGAAQAARRPAATPRPGAPLVSRPLRLEVRLSADHWQGDIHIPERWGTEMRLEARGSVHFRFAQTGSGPSTVTCQVFRGPPPTGSGRQGRPLLSTSLGPPPGTGKAQEFDVDLTGCLPVAPDGKDYYARLVGPNSSGTVAVWSWNVKLPYRQQEVTQFPSPTLTRVVGTTNARGEELTRSQTPVAVITQNFGVEGADLDEVPGETVVQVMQGSKVVSELRPIPALTKRLPSGRTVLSMATPRTLERGLYSARVKSPWGTTGTRPLYVGGNRGAQVSAWRLVAGGTYENHAWTEECQGIATDGHFWYISSNNDGERAVYKFSIDMQLVGKADMEGYGSAHVGALDCHNGNLYIALEQPKQLVVMPTTLAPGASYQLYGTTKSAADPVAGTFPWCAVNPVSGDLYGSSFSYVEHVYYYRKADPQSFLYAGAVRLDRPAERVQGGVITSGGKLLLACDADPKGIYVYNVYTGAFLGSVLVPDPEGELEGVTVSPPGTAVVKGSPVNVHLVVLENEVASKDDVYFKHVAVPSLDDLFGF
jgi:hypothetical protein